MTPRPVYVAAPFGDADPARVRWNVARAEALARLLFLEGLAPVSVHGPIASGIYGDDRDPEERARGTAATLAALEAFTKGGGFLVALARDDGELSRGTEADVEAVEDLGGRVVVVTWRELGARFSLAGLRATWEALAEPWRSSVAGPRSDELRALLARVEAPAELVERAVDLLASAYMDGRERELDLWRIRLEAERARAGADR